MKSISVHASKEYCVKIGKGLLGTLPQELKSLGSAQKVAIISDSNVSPLYGEQVRLSLEDAGLQICSFVFPAGEDSKNGSTFLSILNFLAENQLTRTDCVIALGGGVVGDITGFAAATYLRGIAYIQIPTTLLSMVDSSVGGKTAIDLPTGKNLAGAFYQPNLVLCDLDTLSTLPESIFCDGCAEVIKYGILFDEALFSHLQQHGLNFDREYVVARCVELKSEVVQLDEFDRGDRQKLNLGHTFGHAIEALSNFTVSHGKAVAIGMAMAAHTAWKKGICDHSVVEKVSSILSDFHLPDKTEYSAQQICQCALSDKKRTGNTLSLILPDSIGSCGIYPIIISELLSFIEAGF